MDSAARRVLASFPGRRVVVVGDALLDRWLRGRTTRLSREAPVPVVDLDDRLDVAGGAANTARNLAALGAQVSLVAPIGDDPEGDALEAITVEGSVRADVVRVPGWVTPTKHRLVAGGQVLIRFDAGGGAPLPATSRRTLADRLQRHLETADAVVVSDYGTGVRTPETVAALRGWDGRRPTVCAVDARAPAAWRAIAPTLVKPNWQEAAALLGLPAAEDGDRAEAVRAHGDRLLALTGARLAAVTLDADGALVLERGAAEYRTWATPGPASSTTGAGDTYVAAFTLALAAGAGTVAAAELASAAAGVVVRKPGTAVCVADELAAEDPAFAKHVVDVGSLSAVVRTHRLAGRRIVFTNGCFDLLHRGHVTYLTRAKALGDVLVVAVNDDASVAALKGQGRPIVPLADRLEVLAALSCVDHVTAFGGDSPRQLLSAVRPDVYAKGGDYAHIDLPEAELVASLGGEVRLLEYLQDHSTTGLIARIGDGASA